MKQRKLLILLGKVNNKPRFAAIVASALLLVSGLGQAASYRWVDQDGNVVYSQTKPPPGQEAKVIKPPPPPAEPDARQRLNEQMLKLEDAREDRELGKQEAAEKKSRQATRQRNCEALSNNIDGIRNAPPNRLVKDSDGNYTRMNQDDRRERLEKLEARYDEECR